jgi:hypothetical protein
MPMSQEQIRRHYDELSISLNRPPLNSPEALLLLAVLLGNHDFLFPTAYSESCEPLRVFLKHEDPEVQRLTQLAISLHILSSSKIKEIVDGLKPNPISLEFPKRPLLSFFPNYFRGDLLSLDAARWQAFCTAIQGSHITSLNLRGNELVQLDAARWQAFCTAIQGSHITSLNLRGNKLVQLDAARWQAFCTASQGSHITSLNLRGNELAQLDAARWQAFCTAIQGSRITSLDLGYNGLAQLDAARWQTFCTASQGSQITSLNLRGNDLVQLDSACWQAFCTAIQGSQITSLNLRDNSLFRLDATRWQTFCTAIQGSQITSLNLRGTDLVQLDSVRWQAFCTAIQGSQITSLNLRDNSLFRLDAADWQAFCTAIQESQITSLNLRGNNLYILNAARWQAFCTTIQGSHITSLNLTYNYLARLDATCWHSLYQALENNPYLVIMFEALANVPGGITELIYHHQEWQTIRTKAQDVLAAFAANPLMNEHHANGTAFTEQDYLEQEPLALTYLTEKLSTLATLSVPGVEKVIVDLQRLQNEYRWLYARKLIEEKEITNPSILLGISPKSEYYLPAHEQAFNQIYFSLRDSGEVMEGAFVSALPCCFDEDGTWLPFNEEIQTTIDSLLLEAVTKETGVFLKSELLADATRIALLKYLLLYNFTQQNAAPSSFAREEETPVSAAASSASSAFFSQTRQLGLRDELQKGLPKNITHQNVNDETIQQQINNLWDKFIMIPLSKENESQQALIQAITQLAQKNQVASVRTGLGVNK